jgi:hypothetical protein
MDSNSRRERQQAHSYIDHLPDAQIAAVRGLLEVMLDPVSRALANAPVDDEPSSEDEEQAVARSKEWFRHNEGTPFEQVAAELGFSMEQLGGPRPEAKPQPREKDPAA